MFSNSYQYSFTELCAKQSTDILMTTCGQDADDDSQQQQSNKLHPTTNTAAEMIS